jgi:formamidopyrimidine-DNA glycosylase
MPELPELEVVCEVLNRRIIGLTISAAEIVPPGGIIVVRDLTHAGFAESLAGAVINRIIRRGKFLVFFIQSTGASIILAINPKLSGRLQLATPADKRLPKTLVVFSMSNLTEMRYVDRKQMGQVYLAPDLESLPDFDRLGPEPFDLSLEEFVNRLKHYRGEIKGILTRGDCVAGIGNAYADEILWAARLYPYRKRTNMTPAEMDRLYQAVQSTLSEAIEKVRTEMGEAIHLKPRDFMAVHMKTGQPCPRCGTRISLVGANQRITNFCRTCQPGGLIKGMG